MSSENSTGFKMPVRKIVMLVLAIAAFLFFWSVPRSFFGLATDGSPLLTIVEQRTVAIFVLAAFMWMFEILPTWTTSITVIVIMLLTISDSCLGFLKGHGIPEEFGTLVSYKSLMSAFADPTIMLFLGGFILAIAATKSGLDVRLAKALLKPFGTQPKYVLLGFLIVIGVFSMFMSNTATAAMMLTFLTPVLRTLPKDDKGVIGLALSIPVAANIGGIGTPIGTPPNAIALSYLNETMHEGIGFGEWMLVMVPFVAFIMFIAWRLLLKLFPFKSDKIVLQIDTKKEKSPKDYIVYATFAITILMWVFDKYTGVNANVVALIPVGVFCATGVITANDLKKIEWSVLWLVAGGFALGIALNKTGLAEHLVQSIPFRSWSPIMILIISGLIGYLMSNFISHSAAASLLVPILSAVGVGMVDMLVPIGGVRTLLIGLAISTSFAMLFPISTPPNAIAHSTGLIQVKDMTKVGAIMGAIGLITGYIILIFVGI